MDAEELLLRMIGYEITLEEIDEMEKELGRELVWSDFLGEYQNPDYIYLN